MAFADPESNIKQFDLAPGHHVVDLGAGSGFYTLAAARAVGGSGKVFAVEVQKDLLDRIKNTASREGLHNVAVVWGDIEKYGGTLLRDHSIDRAIVSNVLFQAEDKPFLAKEVNRILKSGGKVLVVDWSSSGDISGPDPRHVMPESDARRLFEESGFAIERGITAGAHHYGFIAVKG